MHLHLHLKNQWFPVIVQCFAYATLGHNIEGDVIGHPYFGTEKVINDLKKFISYSSGLVELKKEYFIRNNNEVVEISV